MTRDLEKTLLRAIEEDPLRPAIQSVELFGSQARGDARPDSDIDLLVEFKPGAKVGLEFFAFADRLEQRTHRRVDLATPDAVYPAFRDSVIRHARRIL